VPAGVIEQQSWAPLGLIDVIVHNGIVELGTLLEKRKRRALILAGRKCARSEGCKQSPVYVYPISGMAIGSPEQAFSMQR
jgi:hypothetical protein